MFETLGAPELIVIGVLLILLFGAGKLGKLGGDLGTSVKEFRHALRNDDEPPPEPAATVVAPAMAEPASPSTPSSDEPALQRPPAIF